MFPQSGYYAHCRIEGIPGFLTERIVTFKGISGPKEQKTSEGRFTVVSHICNLLVRDKETYHPIGPTDTEGEAYVHSMITPRPKEQGLEIALPDNPSHNSIRFVVPLDSLQYIPENQIIRTSNQT